MRLELQPMWRRLDRWPAAGVLVAGLLVGLAWGTLARLWMRLVSTDPEFTWSGSIFIAGAFGVAGAMQAVAVVARRWRWAPGRAAGRVMGAVGMTPLFLGAGATMLPTVLGGGLAIGQRGWPRTARVFAAVVAIVPVAIVTADLAKDFGIGLRALGGLLGLLVVYAGVVVAVSATLGRDPGAAPLPKALRVVAVVVGIAVLLVATVGLAGLRRTAGDG